MGSSNSQNSCLGQHSNPAARFLGCVAVEVWHPMRDSRCVYAFLPSQRRCPFFCAGGRLRRMEARSKYSSTACCLPPSHLASAPALPLPPSALLRWASEEARSKYSASTLRSMECVDEGVINYDALTDLMTLLVARQRAEGAQAFLGDWPDAAQYLKVWACRRQMPLSGRGAQCLKVWAW
eukprot:50518-Chlamydomonas_euryale.AAC.1